MDLNKKSSMLTEFWLYVALVLLLISLLIVMFFLSNSRKKDNEKVEEVLVSNVYLTSLSLNFLNMKVLKKDLPKDFEEEIYTFLSEKEEYEIRELYYFFVYVQDYDSDRSQKFLNFLEEERVIFLSKKEKSLETFFTSLKTFGIEKADLKNLIRLNYETYCTENFFSGTSSVLFKNNPYILQFDFRNYHKSNKGKICLYSSV